MRARWIALSLVFLGSTPAVVAEAPEGSASRDCEVDIRLHEHMASDAGEVTFEHTSRCVAGGRIRLYAARVAVAAATFRVRPGAAPVPLVKLLDESPADADRVGINGGFYDDGRPMGLVISGARRRTPLTATGGSGVFYVAGGVPGIVHRDAFHAVDLPEEALQSIDRLVDAGRNLVSPVGSTSRDARSAIAIDRHGDVWFVAAFDERAITFTGAGYVRLGVLSTRSGLTLGELGDLLVTPRSRGGFGAWTALNLDGGVSTSFIARVDGRTRSVVGAAGTINAIEATVR